MSAHLAGRLNYAKGERDMILMRHEVTVNLKDGCHKIRGAPSVLVTGQLLLNIWHIRRVVMLFLPGDSEMAGQQKGTEGNQLGEFLIVGLSPC